MSCEQRAASRTDILRTVARIGPSPFNGATHRIMRLSSANDVLAAEGKALSSMFCRFSS
jgi:hypothetical protein